MPEDLHERYIALYRTFADAWRVTDKSSLFVYAPGTSTATFTDRDWPAEQPPCELKPQFEIPGVSIPAGIDLEAAKRICQAVTEEDLNQDCVFDVATTGDEVFAQAYQLAQALRLRGTAVQIVGNQPCLGPDDSPGIVATVMPLREGRPTPAGAITFLVDGEAAGRRVRLDEHGRACLPINRLTPGKHKIQAFYRSSGSEVDYHSSASPILQYTVEKGRNPKPGWIDRLKYFWLILIRILMNLTDWRKKDTT